jgi:hypothetical protein
MQWTMSKKLCEALRIMQIRSQRRRLPRRSAYLWSGMVKPRSCEVESVYESSTLPPISKRRYGIEMGGNWKYVALLVKSSPCPCESLWLVECKSSSSIEGARSDKMSSQIHKTSHPELGCSGDLNLTVTVHPVNVGTSCFGGYTGLAAVDEKHEGREIRSSRSQGKPDTWRRTLASCGLIGSRETAL